jgi:hypothetical protein
MSIKRTAKPDTGTRLPRDPSTAAAAGAVAPTPEQKTTPAPPAAGPSAGPVPRAGWAPTPAAELKKAIAAWDGSLDRAFDLVGAATRLMPAEVLALALDEHQPARARELVTDVLVARAAELDPSAWTALVRALPTANGAVAENLVEALTTLTPFLDERARAALAKEIGRLAPSQPGVKLRIEVLTQWLETAGEAPSSIPTKPLRTSTPHALSPAEKTELQSVVPVDDEATVNAKIPKDLARRSTFARDFYSKGHLGAGVPGLLVCDTGNALEPGVCDHHQLGERTCAAALVLNRAELIVEHHQNKPIDTLICHSSPDLDAVSSVFFAELILRDGAVPPGASRLAYYVSQEDNARMPVGGGDPTKHLATLTREAALRLGKDRHPSAEKDPPPEIQRKRDDEVLAVVKGILAYVLAAGKDPTDESLFTNLEAKDPAILPEKTKADILALQAIVEEAEKEARSLLSGVSFGDGNLPRLDGKGTLDVHLALTPTGGKRLDSMLRERHRADIVIISTPDYTWTAAEPTSGASLRPIAAAYEALERQKARSSGVDRQPGAGDRLQPGWSTKNPYYIGGTDTFIVTPRGATLTGAERLRALAAAAHVTWSQP